MNREQRINDMIERLTFESDISNHIFTDREHLVRCLSQPLVSLTATLNTVAGTEKMTDAMCYVEASQLGCMGISSSNIGRKIWGREMHTQILEKLQSAITEERNRKVQGFTPSLAYIILQNNR